jgi:hypothetical protein
MKRSRNSERFAKNRRQWNASRMLGVKRAQKAQQVWAIRFRLDRDRRLRDRAMFDPAIHSRLRGCDVVQVKICESACGLTPDRRRRQTAPSVLEVTDFQRDFDQEAGSRLDAERSNRRSEAHLGVIRGP